MKNLSAMLLALVAACSPIGFSATVPADPCEYSTYQNPACGGGYDWVSGYYNTAHIWIVPHYRRRTVIVSPGIYHGPVYGGGYRPVTTVRTTIVPRTYSAPVVRPSYRQTVTRSVVRPSVTVTRTRIR